MCRVALIARLLTWISLMLVLGSPGAAYLQPVRAETEGVEEYRFPLAAGEYHACAARGGALFCWGRNNEGQL